MADSIGGCLDVPPYPAGAGPGCILWSDGIHFHWSDPPTAEGQTPTWNGHEIVWANPAAAVNPAPKGPGKHGPL